MEILNLPTTIPQPADSEAVASETTSITGISEPAILRYFETLNAEEFEATGQLFAIDGALQPPFEKPIVGPAAIATYLQAEAKGFNLQPREGVTQQLENDCTEVQVSGKVQTPLFTVNVSWLFILNPDQKLLFAKIKLLASPQELLKLRR